MKSTAFKLILALIFVSLSAQATLGSEKLVPMRNLKDLYGIVNSEELSKVESDAVILKDYTLIVLSGTWWNGSTQAENLWEGLAEERANELNLIVVYDAPNQDLAKIKSKASNTKLYEFFDQKRGFYYWFSQKTLMDAVLIGPKGEILFEGLLNSPEKIQLVKNLIKKKGA